MEQRNPAYNRVTRGSFTPTSSQPVPTQAGEPYFNGPVHSVYPPIRELFSHVLTLPVMQLPTNNSRRPGSAANVQIAWISPAIFFKTIGWLRF
jgi:hypothetical protein